MVQSILLVSSETAIDSPTPSTTDSNRHGNNTSSSSQLTGLSGLSLSPALRAHTYVTLGIQVTINNLKYDIKFNITFFAHMHTYLMSGFSLVNVIYIIMLKIDGCL